MSPKMLAPNLRRKTIELRLDKNSYIGTKSYNKNDNTCQKRSHPNQPTINISYLTLCPWADIGASF